MSKRASHLCCSGMYVAAAWVFTLITEPYGFALTSTLSDWAFYVDGVKYEFSNSDSMPTMGGLTSEGFGTLTWSTTTAGNHTFIAFFDLDMDKATNTYYNEYGFAQGSAGSGQSWEIDEPGWVFGDIYQNVANGALDNANGVPIDAPDDVSMALGWDFSLTNGEMAIISLILEDGIPASSFYLGQTDPDSAETVYFSSTLNVKTAPAPVPEPSTLILLGAGIAGVACFRKRYNIIKG